MWGAGAVCVCCMCVAGLVSSDPEKKEDRESQDIGQRLTRGEVKEKKSTKKRHSHRKRNNQPQKDKTATWSREITLS